MGSSGTALRHGPVLVVWYNLLKRLGCSVVKLFGFWLLAEGLAEDAAKGLPEENPEGCPQSTPEGTD